LQTAESTQVRPKPRILLITDIARGWRQPGRAVDFLAQIQAARTLVDLDILAIHGADPLEVSAMADLQGQVIPIPSQGDAGPALLPPSVPPSERAEVRPGCLAALEAHLSGRSYQAVLIGSLRLSYLRHAKGLPALRILAAGAPQIALAEETDAEQTLRILSSFRLILARQFQHYPSLASLFPGRVAYWPGILPEVACITVAPTPERIVLTGEDTQADRDSLNWFLAQIWPCFRHRQVELHVAGSVCRAVSGRHANLVLRGDIQDLSAFLRPADIAIDPAFHAAPATGRAATYLRHGIPSILTVEASRDLPGGAGEAYLLARSRAEFIAQLDQLLRSQALRQSLSAAAYRLAHRAFSPAALAARWGAVAALAQAG
jgi:hypothetical protein